MTDSCKDGNEGPGSVHGKGFIHQLRNYELPKKNSVPRTVVRDCSLFVFGVAVWNSAQGVSVCLLFGCCRVLFTWLRLPALNYPD
jgi:hypothetical protein